MTKGEINRIGKKLKDSNTRTQALNQLAVYRQSFHSELTSVYNICNSISLAIERNSITVARLKRYSTIESKLNRLPTMNLAQIQDIAGCRVIFEKQSSVDTFIEKMADLPEYTIIRRSDYITTPKENGYKSYHLIMENNGSKRIVEVQVRTREHHNWATLVETTDNIFKTNLKENSEPQNFREILKILSKNDQSITPDELRLLFKFNHKKKYISELMSIFIHNIREAEEIWQNSKPNSAKSSYVLEVNATGMFNIKSYVSKKKAETKFLESYLANEDLNTVLIQLNKPNFVNLVFAYSNYILIGNDLVIRYQNLLSIYIKNCLENKQWIKTMSRYMDLHYLYDMELDWALAYLKSSIRNGEKKTTLSSFHKTEFQLLMDLRIKKLVSNIKELEKFSRQKGDNHFQILNAAREVFGYFHKKRRKKKIDEINELLNF